MSVWEAVTGQDDRLGPLKAAAVDDGAMTHAWLITGPPGSGRSVAATAFAAALECPDHGCGVCHSCETVLKGTHPDVTHVTTEQVQIKIDEVRHLVASASRLPGTGKWRIVIVEDADRMAENTTNVLLKSIEEPPSRTVWILCTPSPRDVLPTIRSRCRHVGLRIPSVEAVTRLLADRDGVDPEIARTSALAAQCHIGIARRLARDPAARERRDQALALATEARSVGTAVIAAGRLVDAAGQAAKTTNEERGEREKAELRQALGVEEGARVPAQIRSQLTALDKEIKGRTRRVLRDTLDRNLVDLLSYYRDVLVLQTRAGVQLINQSRARELAQAAETSSVAATLRRLDAIGQARTRLGMNVTPALAVEAMAVDLAYADTRPA
ncbi:MAG: DNA polymerase III subunit delta' [Bifidobacteriaceae bacterium]|jgi:DNA polymerase-3 subunit delta'|nr:DNA polymerase III subunit delta' [Bifidobacteriaceae bacterium]